LVTPEAAAARAESRAKRYYNTYKGKEIDA